MLALQALQVDRRQPSQDRDRILSFYSFAPLCLFSSFETACIDFHLSSTLYTPWILSVYPLVPPFTGRARRRGLCIYIQASSRLSNGAVSPLPISLQIRFTQSASVVASPRGFIYTQAQIRKLNIIGKIADTARRTHIQKLDADIKLTKGTPLLRLRFYVV